MFDVETFWAEILSEDPARVQAAYLSLPAQDEREAVYLHLQKMVSEEGWQPIQRQAAQAALTALAALRGTA
jgi:hypothetical protein